MTIGLLLVCQKFSILHNPVPFSFYFFSHGVKMWERSKLEGGEGEDNVVFKDNTSTGFPNASFLLQ
jgi:hypothetical protein